MTVHTKKTAVCDTCGWTIDIDPNSIQVYVYLHRYGWTSMAFKDRIETYCPDHPLGESY